MAFAAEPLHLIEDGRRILNVGSRLTRFALPLFYGLRDGFDMNAVISEVLAKRSRGFSRALASGQRAKGLKFQATSISSHKKKGLWPF